MAKAKNPICISGHFAVTASDLEKSGVLDATLAIDTNLFIDPLLLRDSKHPEISKRAPALYKEHFGKILKLLLASKKEGDPAWRAAKRLVELKETKEIRGTCLGYGAGSIHGSAIGPELAQKILGTAKSIVDIGIDDPDLFPAMALFEEDIGPDRLSDITTSIILPALAAFNRSVLKELRLKGEEFVLPDKTKAEFLVNPFEPERSPVVLVPTDILRDLPIARDWDDVQAAAEHNQALRDRVNEHVAEIWVTKSKRSKRRLKDQALLSDEAFKALLDSIRAVKPTAYDTKTDPDGLVHWAPSGRAFADAYPLTIKKPKHSLEGLFSVVKVIVAQYRHLIENCGLSKELYSNVKAAKPRHESTAQRLFFAVAYNYCKANDVDISPEIDTGNGKVDFKFSTGFHERVLVEIKLSTNSSVVAGYTKQLEAYRAAQETMKAIYLVIDVGKMGGKGNSLIRTKNKAQEAKEPVSELEFVNGIVTESASKRR